MIDHGLMQHSNDRVHPFDNSFSFNFLICKDDGQVAWTVAPVSIGELCTDNFSEFVYESLNQEQFMKGNFPEDDVLETQSKPTDEELFPFPETCQIKQHLPKLEPRSPKRNTVPVANKGTVRIYARSLRLTKSPLANESVHPSVITVERAALCQIFLETKYHKTFQQPSERDLRRKTLETLVSKGKELTLDEKIKFNEILKSVESEWSRLSRVRPSIDAFNIEKRLGSGGFGVVNMVTEKQTEQVYAMKSISKDKTLRCGHEGRVLCERDLLKKASESGSRWICKLHYAFQDTQALHLVLEYMGGGDFLMLLLQKAPLREDETCFYLAEMINGIDACHKLGFMHRDVKPDNFLVSSSGHLKIADFGLATSGEWIYQESYRSSRRKDLLRKYHKSIIEDGAEETTESSVDPPSHHTNLFILNPERLRKMHADSVVGTYYYMAPEVLQGGSYNATADWYSLPLRFDRRWSLGIIMFECLFGYPPFWASTRRATQKIIMDWMNTLEIPIEPRTSDPAKRLIKALLSSASTRLRTPTWEVDLCVQQGHPVSAFQRMQVFKKDVRNHGFFRGAKLDFETVHLMKAPGLPELTSTSPTTKMSKGESGPGKVEHANKTIKTKDVMLHDERVLKERRTSAFKNYTYRGPDLGVVLQRFAEAIDNNTD